MGDHQVPYRHRPAVYSPDQVVPTQETHNESADRWGTDPLPSRFARGNQRKRI
jgi:hypothetical protein